MAMARIIDGRAIAAKLRARVGELTLKLKAAHGVTPGLAVVLVGGDPASEIYVKNKAKQTVAAGMASFEHRLDTGVSETELTALICRLNADDAVHGILVQLPLPDHIESAKIIELIDPLKDVDGFHAINAGRLMTGQPAMVPCTPTGCVMLAKQAAGSLEGLEAVVIGRSNIVGKPLAQLLLRENCTVTIAHSRTKNLAEIVRRADLVFAAVGQKELVRGDWIKPQAIVIDVGIHRVKGASGKVKLVGDVAFDEVGLVAGAITPVPGGVGPMTIACLLANTLVACYRSLDLADPEI